MGWRFRRSFRIAPGLRLNMGKSGFTSISVGGRGATLNVGKRGTTSTFSLPGTGLSYQHRHKTPSSAQPPTVPAGPVSGRTVAVRACAFAVVIVGGYLALRSLTPETSSPTVPMPTSPTVPAASEPIPSTNPVVSHARQVSTIRANVRASPSISGSVVRTFMLGQAVQVLQIENGWTRVALPDGVQIGWMHISVLK